MHAARRVGGALLALAAGLALVGQFRMPLTGDVAFHLDAARRMLEGAVLYQDVSAPETPFVFWSAMPAAALAGSGAEAGTILRVLTLLIALAVLGLLIRVRAAAGIPAGFVLVALVFPVWYFTTPEHLAFVLLVPYVTLAARGDEDGGDRWPAAVAGALAAAAAALELAMLIVIGAVLAARLWRARSARVLASAEQLGMAAGLVVATALMLPMAPELIGVFREAGPANALAPAALRAHLARDIHVWTALLALGAALVFGRSGSGRHATGVLAAATAGGLAAAIAQRTGEGPDAFAALGFAVLLLMTLILREGATRLGAGRVTAVLMLVPAGYLFGAVTWRRAHAVFTRTRADQLVVMRMLGAEPAAVAVLSSDISDAYPAVLELNHRFVLRYPGFWAARLSPGHPAVKRVSREYGEDLRRSPPVALVVRAPTQGERRPGEAVGNHLALLCRDDVARSALQGYRLAERAGGFELYRPGATGAAACVSS